MVRTTLRSALTATALAVATLVAVAAPAAAHPGLPSNRFDPNSVSWASIRDRSPGNFDLAVNQYRANDFIPVDIDADAAGSSYVLGGAFQRNLDDREWLLEPHLTNAQYEEFWDDAAAANFRPADLETYVVDGVRYYATLWVEDVENYAWVTKRHLTKVEWFQFRTDQMAANRIIVDVDQYVSGNTTLFAAIAIHNAENLAWTTATDMTLASFDNFADDRYDDGYRFLVAESVLSPADGQRFTGVFVDNVNGRGAPARGQFTSAQYGDWWSDLAGANRVINQERYETASGTRYLGVWRQNT